jgi:hypothetical protein
LVSEKGSLVTAQSVPVTVVEILQTEAQLIIDHGWVGQEERRPRTAGGEPGLDLAAAAALAIGGTPDPEALAAQEREIFDEVIESIEAKIGMTVGEYVDSHLDQGAMSIAFDLCELAWQFERELDPAADR